jgi:SRSO17 transposase
VYGDGVVCDGLLLAGERKSIAPIAARLAQDPSEVEAIRQRLQQAVVVADWEDDILRRRMSLQLQKELGDLEALIGDDTGLPKHGMPSVGTARQYSGTLGRMDRCQVVPSLHAAGPSGSFCVGAQLYMPQSWMDDPVRLHKVGVPESIAFATKWQIMLGLLDRARSGGVRKLPFISDAGYGDVAEFRRELNGRTHEYLLEVMCTTAVWAPGTGPEPPLGRQPGRMGRPQTQYRDGEHVPLSVAELALSQTEDALQSVSWRNGDGPVRHSRFGALRVQPASGHCHGLAPEPEQWLLWEWVEGAELPEHYWLSTLARGHAAFAPCVPGEAALASGARLPRDEGRGGAGPLRGPHLARAALSPFAVRDRARLPGASTRALATTTEGGSCDGASAAQSVAPSKKTLDSAESGPRSPRRSSSPTPDLRTQTAHERHHRLLSLASAPTTVPDSGARHPCVLRHR